MADTNSENKSQTGSNPGVTESTGKDWREERWEWHRKRREARQKYSFHGIFPGLILILIGGLFLSYQQNWISGNSWWQYLLIGLGVISIISGLVQYRMPESHHWGRGRFIWGTALIVLGVLFLLGFSHWWPVILIGIGLTCLLSFC